jgi:hypothetical protein
MTMLRNTPASQPRDQVEQTVAPVQTAPKPNRSLESKLDRLIFGSASVSTPRFGLE